MSEASIQLEGLSKRYGSKLALDGLDLAVEPGTVCGLIGPNGAGKTTTIRMLLGLSRPTAGRVRVLGLDPMAEPIALKQRVGYVPEQHHIYEWMTARRVLAFTADVYPTWSVTEQQRLTERLGLPVERKVKDLSRGELAKLALVIALAHGPDLLILDEPTSGLDPIVRREFLDAIIELVGETHRSVLFSTHILSDAERIADQIVVLDHGRLSAAGSIDSIRARFRKVSFLFAEAPDPALEVPGAVRVERGIREWVAVLAACSDEAVASLAVTLGATDWSTHPMDLEGAFVELVRQAGEPEPTS